MTTTIVDETSMLRDTQNIFSSELAILFLWRFSLSYRFRVEFTCVVGYIQIEWSNQVKERLREEYVKLPLWPLWKRVIHECRIPTHILRETHSNYLEALLAVFVHHRKVTGVQLMLKHRRSKSCISRLSISSIYSWHKSRQKLPHIRRKFSWTRSFVHASK